MRVKGIEAIGLENTGGDRIKCPKQQEAYWIYNLKAIRLLMGTSAV